MPQIFVRVPRVKLHPHRRTRNETQLGKEFRPRKYGAFNVELAKEAEVTCGNGDGSDAARRRPGGPFVVFAIEFAIGASHDDLATNRSVGAR